MFLLVGYCKFNVCLVDLYLSFVKVWVFREFFCFLLGIEFFSFFVRFSRKKLGLLGFLDNENDVLVWFLSDLEIVLDVFDFIVLVIVVLVLIFSWLYYLFNYFFNKLGMKKFSVNLSLIIKLFIFCFIKVLM